MNCCNANGDCNQGRECPIRVCRQRAGRPADYEIWSEIKIKPTPEQLAEWEQQDRSDRLSIAFLVAVIVAMFVVVFAIGVRG